MESHFSVCWRFSFKSLNFVIANLTWSKQNKPRGSQRLKRKGEISTVLPKFGTVVTHDPAVLPGQRGSTRNLPYYKGKYFIQSKLNTVYVKGVKIKYMYLLFAYSC